MKCSMKNSFVFNPGCHQTLRQVLKYKQKEYNKGIDIEGFPYNIDNILSWYSFEPKLHMVTY